MTEVHLEEAQLKRKAIESSRRVIALVDSSKIGKEDLTTFARPNQISHLFTDSRLSLELAEKLRQAGVDFTICEVVTPSILRGPTIEMNNITDRGRRGH
jgi:DeoR/GlpR family transcriptional regulator of sugar metabolism